MFIDIETVLKIAQLCVDLLTPANIRAVALAGPCAPSEHTAQPQADSRIPDCQLFCTTRIHNEYICDFDRSKG